MSGSVPYSIGLSTVIRIPIPNSGGLAIELSPRGWVPRGGSTSVLFFQDLSGKRHLRLDFGYNVASRTIDFHWNQSRTHTLFGIDNHAAVGPAGRVAYQGFKLFRRAGRTFGIAGAALDIASIVLASQPLARATSVVAAWAVAWAGCKGGGALGAAAGTMGSPLGAALGGVAGCVIGGIAGYQSGELLGSRVYAWAAGTHFVALATAGQP